MRRRLGLCLGTAIVVAAALCTPLTVSATSASATLSAGSLAFASTPPSVSFSGTLNGADQTLSASQAVDVGDATGSGAGWNITATSTTFSTGGGSPHTLSDTATSVTAAPVAVCDSGSTCTTASNSVSYTYMLPAGTSAPTATKVFNATANTGLGNQIVSIVWKLSVPSSTVAGTYNSTWTLSLVSGP